MLLVLWAHLFPLSPELSPAAHPSLGWLFPNTPRPPFSPLSTLKPRKLKQLHIFYLYKNFCEKK